MYIQLLQFSLVFGPHSCFLQGISFLQTPLLMVELFWWFPSSTSLLPPVSPILPPSQLTIGWEGIFDWKCFEWNGILHPFTMFKILGSCVIFIQEPTKCFNLPLVGMSEILFDKNNLFINGWPFLDSTELVFLDLNLCWRSFAVEQLFLPYFCYWFLSVCSRYDAAVVIVYHYGTFSIWFLWEKTFDPHIFSVHVRG